jgi:hypothetical protein
VYKKYSIPPIFFYENKNVRIIMLIIFLCRFFSIFVPFVEVLLQTYIRVLQLKTDEENELTQEKNNFAEKALDKNVKEIANHVKIVRPQEALGPWQDKEIRR